MKKLFPAVILFVKAFFVFALFVSSAASARHSSYVSGNSNNTTEISSAGFPEQHIEQEINSSTIPVITNNNVLINDIHFHRQSVYVAENSFYIKNLSEFIIFRLPLFILNRVFIL